MKKNTLKQKFFKNIDSKFLKSCKLYYPKKN